MQPTLNLSQRVIRSPNRGGLGIWKDVARSSHTKEQ